MFWVFLPSLHGDFIDIDDGVFVIRNTHINLTPGNVVWAFCHSFDANWIPLTLWSFMLDHQFYGLKPWGYHLTNVLLHAFNTVLLFLVLRRMTGLRPEKRIGAAAPQAGATWRSLVVAGLFGLHPLRVESVAWISERKDVLSVTFWMLTLWAYTRYAQERSSAEPSSLRSAEPRSRKLSARGGGMALDPRRWIPGYGLALLFFALSLMSKPMMVTLPCVLLLLDYWPLARWQRKNLRGLLMEKTPFFLLSAIVSVVTCFTQKNADMMSNVLTGLSLSFGARLENALVSYARYLAKLFWPVNLCALYPYPDHWPMQKILFAGLLVLGLSVLVYIMRRRQPCLPTGWLWYLGTLVPVLGLVPVGAQAMADRYSYIPSIGILIVLVWGTCQVTRGWHCRSIGLGAAGGVLALICIVLTRHQIVYWKNDVSVWERAIAVTENNYDAHNMLGRAWFAQGRVDDAIREFQEVVRLNPGFAEAHNVLGRSFATQGRVDEAMACYQKALEIRPNYVAAHNNLSVLLAKMGRVDEAIVQYRRALEIEPKDVTIINNLGASLISQGRFDEAIACFQNALQINPDYAEAQNNLGNALLGMRKVDEAIVHFKRALEIQPDSAAVHIDLGAALNSQGRFDEAIVCFQKALQINPDNAEAHDNLAFVLFSQGRLDETIRELQATLRLKPDQAETHCNLGFVLGKRGRFDEAIHEYQEALRLKPDYTQASNDLVAALGWKAEQAKQPANSSKP
jgi:tetratricopeptide (TPR) repeat protein